MADSASLTAGAVAAAPIGHRGATLAVHAALGFSAGFLGPLVIGAVLDLFGGGTLAWGLAFVTMGLGSLAGPVALSRSGKTNNREEKCATETQRHRDTEARRINKRI